MVLTALRVAFFSTWRSTASVPASFPLSTDVAAGVARVGPMCDKGLDAAEAKYSYAYAKLLLVSPELLRAQSNAEETVKAPTASCHVQRTTVSFRGLRNVGTSQAGHSMDRVILALLSWTTTPQSGCSQRQHQQQIQARPKHGWLSAMFIRARPPGQHTSSSIVTSITTLSQ
jgi:hypothetical protein